MGPTNGRRKRSDKPVTIRKVASRAKVSVATVSRVLNHHRGVKKHLRQAVEEAIRGLGYEYKPSRPSGGQGHPAYRIGLVVASMLNPFHALLLKGISSAALVHDVELVLLDAEEDVQTERQHLLRVLEGGAIHGLIYIPFAQQLDPAVDELIERRFPMVFLDRVLERDDTCTVSSDNVEGAYQAVTYLLDLGHRDIAFIAGPPQFSTTRARLEGYSRGLKEYGLPVRDDLVLAGDTSFETAYAEVQKFLAGGRSCTAIFGSNDLMAFGAWEAAEARGLRVPQDLSIIGYDEIPFSSYRSLTTIAQPSFEMGRHALTLLVDIIAGRRTPPQRVLLRDSLIIRRSCRKVSSEEAGSGDGDPFPHHGQQRMHP
jgi:DNA-binding LacI/PurR family transcriptional regulator